MNGALQLAQGAVTQPQAGLSAGFVVALGVGWLLFGLAGWLLVWWAPTAARKRRTYRAFAIATGVIFFLFACGGVVAGMPPVVLLMAGPPIALITWANLRLIAFCDACNRMIYRQGWWRPARFRPHCGAALRPSA